MFESRKTRQLLTVALIPMGPHIFRAFWSVLSIYLINSGVLTVFQFGLVLAIESLPSLFIPVFLGSRVRSIEDADKITRRLLLLCCISLVLIWISVEFQLTVTFIISIVLFGAFSCSLTPLQRVLLKHQFHDHAAFAAGFFTSAASISKIAAKLLVVPTVALTGSFQNALVLPITANFLITSIVALFFDKNCDGENAETKISSTHSYQDAYVDDQNEDLELQLDVPYQSEVTSFSVWDELVMVSESIRLLPTLSLGLIYVHTIYFLIFHIIMNYMPYVAVYVWDLSAKEASILAAIPSFMAIPLCPLVGICIYGSHYKQLYCLVAGVLAVVAYALMLAEAKTALLVLLLLSISQSVIFTVILASVAIHTPVELVGTAFGIIEVLNAVCSIIGNIVFGYLCGLGTHCYFGLLFIFLTSVVGCATLVLLACSDIVHVFRTPTNRHYEIIDDL